MSTVDISLYCPICRLNFIRLDGLDVNRWNEIGSAIRESYLDHAKTKDHQFREEMIEKWKKGRKGED